MTLKTAGLKPYLILLAILLVAFLPVSTFYFGMKNDAFSDNFPNKFFLSEAIHSGFFPLWNPYMNFGFPVYADPGFAFWNPITWFFGAVIGYNAYTLTAEVLFYIYIAGICMYGLGKYFNFASHLAIAVAAMYMCSGFFTGNLQHINFLTSAAFLPFLVQRFLMLFQSPNFKNAGLTSIAYYFVFAGGHPAIPIGTIYFLAVLSISIFILNKKIRQQWKILLPYYFLSIFIFILLYSPALYSYLSIVNEYGRSGPLHQMNETAYGFSPTSYLSFLYPFATVKDTSLLTDDLSMRNIFFSFAGFVIVICQFKNKSYLVRSFLMSAAVMLVLSSGGYIKAVLYSHMPFLSLIRTNGEFRVFSILSFCVITGFGLKELEINTPFFYMKYRKIIKILLLVSVLLSVFALVKSYSNFLPFLHINIKNPVTAIKAFINNLNFYNTLLISAIIQSAIILILLASKNNTKKIAVIIITDLIINSMAYLPFTGVGTVALSEIQRVQSANQKGIIIPSMIALKNIDTFFTKETGLVGSASFYNKKIGITNLTDYPSYFTNTQNYFKSYLPNIINNLPYVFLKKDINNSQLSDEALIVDFFSPQKINITVNSSQNDSLILLQNYYKFWKAKIDGHTIAINKSFITFMSIPITKGRHNIEFYYEDKWLLLFAAISITTFLIAAFTSTKKIYN